MRFGSVCSGIEAASVAWHPLGWQAAWLSEIEPFPSAVLAHHYPDVPNLGDMTALPDRIRSGEVEAPDLFCGGTPCQAFSVAGLRNSLDDDRGNLSLTFVEIADAIDDVRRAVGKQPAIIFWENVPGVLNTRDNAFGCFLAGLAGESLPLLPAGWRWTNAGCVLGPKRAIAWRVLDAQYFGVAQRRRRVFVVASSREGFNPTAVLFEFDGVRRDTAPSRESGKGATAGAEGGARDSSAGCWWDGGNVASTMTVNSDNQRMPDKDNAQLVMCPTTDVFPTLFKADIHCVAQSMAVRRLTPIECERLQGFPDGYTNIHWRKASESPAGQRYKALGNSWAVPVVRWIGQRIQESIK